MDWLSFAALGILWAAFLLPSGGRRRPGTSVEEFERKMELLEQTERQTPGRWLLAPKKGEPFIGTRERRRARTVARRRRVFTVLLEALALTLLIGLFPPLRGMWFATIAVGLLLVAYCGMLAHYKEVERATRGARVQRLPARSEAVDVPLGPAAPPPKWQYDTDPKLQLGVLGDNDRVHVVVRIPGDVPELETAHAL
jgi:hypothetical protein